MAATSVSWRPANIGRRLKVQARRQRRSVSAMLSIWVEERLTLEENGQRLAEQTPELPKETENGANEAASI